MGRQTQLLVEFSAHPLKSKYYRAVSIIFSIFRTMDLYQMTKYQSISDRIKRLANTSNPPTNSFPIVPSSKVRMFQSPTAASYQKKEPELPSALNFLQKHGPSRITTQETEGNQDQQSQTLINELLSIRESVTSKVSKRDNRQALTEEVDDKSFINEGLKEKIASKWKKESEKMEGETTTRGLSHVKSQSSLKIEEIMQSYKSYKQNKEQFLAELGQNSKEHQRVVSQNLSKYFDKEPTVICNQEQLKNREGECRQSHIESLWKEVSECRDFTSLDREKVKDNEPKFQKSGKYRAGELEQITELKRRQYNEGLEQDMRPKRNNSKLILRNIRVQKQPIREVSTNINLMLSPRGLRVPGKICKNSDKSIIAQPKWNE